MDIRQATADRILELCAQRKLTISALAQLAALPPSTLKNIVYKNGGSSNPGIVTIKIICDGLDITIPDFFDTEVFRNLEQHIK